jgi:hypothetical protein
VKYAEAISVVWNAIQAIPQARNQFKEALEARDISNQDVLEVAQTVLSKVDDIKDQVDEMNDAMMVRDAAPAAHVLIALAKLTSLLHLFSQDKLESNQTRVVTKLDGVKTAAAAAAAAQTLQLASLQGSVDLVLQASRAFQAFQAAQAFQAVEAAEATQAAQVFSRLCPRQTFKLTTHLF